MLVGQQETDKHNVTFILGCTLLSIVKYSIGFPTLQFLQVKSQGSGRLYIFYILKKTFLEKCLSLKLIGFLKKLS